MFKKLTLQKLVFFTVLAVCLGFLIYKYLPRGEMPKAERLVAAGEYAEALPILKRVVRDEPDNCKARWLLAESYFFTGNPDEAERILIGYAQEVEADPRYASLFAALARFWQEEGDWNRAMDNWHWAMDMGFNITVKEYNESVSLYFFFDNSRQFDFLVPERDDDLTPLTDLVAIWRLREAIFPGEDEAEYVLAQTALRNELMPLLPLLKDPLTWEEYPEDVVAIARTTTDALEAMDLILTLRENPAAFDTLVAWADSWVVQQLLEGMKDHNSPELDREFLERMKQFHPDLEIIERLLQLFN